MKSSSLFALEFFHEKIPFLNHRFSSRIPGLGCNSCGSFFKAIQFVPRASLAPETSPQLSEALFGGATTPWSRAVAGTLGFLPRRPEFLYIPSRVRRSNMQPVLWTQCSSIALAFNLSSPNSLNSHVKELLIARMIVLHCLCFLHISLNVLASTSILSLHTNIYLYLDILRIYLLNSISTTTSY